MSGRLDAEVLAEQGQYVTFESVRLYLRLQQPPGSEPTITIGVPGFSWLGRELTPLFACCCSDGRPSWRRGPSTRETIADIVNDPEQPWIVTPVLHPLRRPWFDGMEGVAVDAPLAFAPADADRHRSLFLQTVVEPQVRAEFATDPALRSAVLVVAQYWDDQAIDEVHVNLMYSELDTPDLGTTDGWYGTAGEAGGYDLRLVALFASFCPEDANQNLDPWRNGAPYALFRRDGDAITTEIVGVQFRPWLDGRMSSATADDIDAEHPDPLGEADDSWLQSGPGAAP